MAKFAAVLLLSVSLFVSCDNNNAVVITPLASYTIEDITGRAEDYCRQYGMIPAEVSADTAVWERLVNEVVRELVNADLCVIHAEELAGLEEPVVSEEDIRSKYDTLLASQKQYFAGKKEIVSAAIKYPRDTIVYYPEGLEWVKYFVVPFESETRGRAAILLSEGRTGDYERLMEEAEAGLSPVTGRLRRQLQGGADFETTAGEYGGVTEDLLYMEDYELFPAQRQALRNLKKPGDIAEYNIYQGHVFMLCDSVPAHVEVPYGEVREEIRETIVNARKIIQKDRLLKKLYEEAIKNRTVKVLDKKLFEKK